MIQEEQMGQILASFQPVQLDARSQGWRDCLQENGTPNREIWLQIPNDAVVLKLIEMIIPESQAYIRNKYYLKVTIICRPLFFADFGFCAFYWY